MIYTPLYSKEEGYYIPRFKKGTKVFAIDTDHNITQNKEYEIVGTNCTLDVEIINDLEEKEFYSEEYFSMTKLY